MVKTLVTILAIILIAASSRQSNGGLTDCALRQANSNYSVNMDGDVNEHYN